MQPFDCRKYKTTLLKTEFVDHTNASLLMAHFKVWGKKKKQTKKITPISVDPLMARQSPYLDLLSRIDHVGHFL